MNSNLLKFFWPYRLVWPKPLCFALDNKGFRSSTPEVSCKKGVHKNIAKFTGKHVSQSLFLIEVQIKINLRTPTSRNGCFCSKLPLHPLLLKRNIIRKLRSIFFTPLCSVSQNFKKACPMFPFYRPENIRRPMISETFRGNKNANIGETSINIFCVIKKAGRKFWRYSLLPTSRNILWGSR